LTSRFSILTTQISLLMSDLSLLYSPSTRGRGFTWKDPSKQGPPAEVLGATVPYPSLNRSKLTSFRQGTVLDGYYCGPLTQSNRCRSFPTRMGLGIGCREARRSDLTF